MTQTATDVRPRGGTPTDWSQRYESKLGIDLPEGANFYVTPGHGYLRVDIRKHHANISIYDYVDGPWHVLLEEDCSLTMWLAEAGLIPMEDYIRKMMKTVPRVCAYGVLHGKQLAPP